MGFKTFLPTPVLAPDNAEVHVVFPIMVVSASVISVVAVLSASNSASRAAVSAACLLRASAVAIVFASEVAVKNSLLYADGGSYQLASLQVRKNPMSAPGGSIISFGEHAGKKHTCGKSVVRAFIFMMCSQLAKDSLKVARDSLRFTRPSTFVWSASVSSVNSASAGSINPSP